MPLMIIGNVIEMRSYMTSAKQTTALESQAGQIVSESVRGIRTVSALGIQPNLVKLYDGLMRGTFDGALGAGKKWWTGVGVEWSGK